MLTDISFLDLTFRLSVFGLLSYKLFQLAKEYLLPFLQQQIILERNQHTELLEKEKLLISTQHRIENQIYNQKQMLTLLEKHVQIWHNTYLNSIATQEKENKKIIEKIQEKRVIQRKNIALSDNIKGSLVQALEASRQELTQRYSTDVGKSLLTKVINQLPLCIKNT